MNKLFRLCIGAVMVSAVVIAITGCTKGNSDSSRDGLIRLGVGGATRAINNLEDLAAVGDNVGIYGVATGLDVSGLPGDGSQWNSAPLMDNVRTTAIDGSTGLISWSGDYYYPTHSETMIEFCAYHPYGAVGATDQPFYLDAPAGGVAPQLHFTLTGAEDVMYSKPVYGRHDVTPGAIEFEHVLTQLRFQIIDDYGTMGDITVKSVTLTGVNRSAVMNIESGVLADWTNSGEIAVPGITEVPVTGTPSAPQALGSEVMLQPGQAAFTIRVETSADIYEDVVIQPTSSIDGVAETMFAAGRSYLITLTFKKQIGIFATATVVPWVIGGTGEAIIQ